MPWDEECPLLATTLGRLGGGLGPAPLSPTNILLRAGPKSAHDFFFFFFLNRLLIFFLFLTDEVFQGKCVLWWNFIPS